jgi:hypothetical protein
VKLLKLLAPSIPTAKFYIPSTKPLSKLRAHLLIRIPNLCADKAVISRSSKESPNVKNIFKQPKHSKTMNVAKWKVLKAQGRRQVIIIFRGTKVCFRKRRI